MSRRNLLTHRKGSQKYERYIQASILLALKIKSSYGYELIQEIPRFGFIEGQAPPGMIYRHLRDLEENGLVASQWETQGAGPAKRVYQLTDEGMAALAFWIEYMESQVQRLARFIQTYREIKSPEKNEEDGH
jgi:PadR family transcriptional regulator, regulatory protein PadR